MRIIRSSEHRIVPWRNGQGTTREVAQMAAQDGHGFDWRISIASIDRPGPFSAFPGIDRTIAVLSGDGFTLRVAGQDIGMSTRTAPHSFAGELDAAAILCAGPSIDLNAMTRRGAFTHCMRRLPAGTSRIEGREAALTLLLASGAMTLEGMNEEIGPLDAVMLESADPEIIVTPAHGSQAFCIAIKPA